MTGTVYVVIGSFYKEGDFLESIWSTNVLAQKRAVHRREGERDSSVTL